MAAQDQHPTQTITTILTLAVTIAAGVAVYEPLKSLRNEIFPPDKVELLHKHEVRARLWEDPLVAVDEHSRRETSGTVHVYAEPSIMDNVRGVPNQQIAGMTIHDNSGQASLKVMPLPAPRPHHFLNLLGREAGQPSPRHKVSILVAITNGRPYAEDVEFRIRQRYAILAGLTVANYQPQANQVLHYFEIGWPISLSRESSKLKVPYEWMESQEDTDKRVLVMWLREDALGSNPLEQLNDLTDRLRSILEHPARRDQKLYDVDPHLRILGPVSSETLAAMYAELECTRSSSVDTKRQSSKRDRMETFLAHTTVYSYMAGVVPTPIDPDPPNSSVSNWPKRRGFCLLRQPFIRINAREEDLLQALVYELEHRQFDPWKQDRVLLIGEWDTQYGRQLETLFSNVFKTNFPKLDLRDRIIFYSYLRGLDGERSGDTNRQDMQHDNGSKAILKAGGSNKELDIAMLERADGLSQFDYVRRNAQLIASSNERYLLQDFTSCEKQFPKLECLRHGGVRAVGVVGSDVFDKLLILQALRKSFPDAIFFTLGLDARLLQDPERKWTRNMLIASGFDLTLDKELQKNIPPFRSSSQTALFLATQAALEDSKHTTAKKLKAAVEASNTPPLASSIRQTWLFEVGRTRAVPLTDMPFDSMPTLDYRRVFYFVSLLTLIAIVLPMPPTKVPVTNLGVLRIIRFILVTGSGWAICYWVSEIARTQTRVVEPFLFFEGVSIWSTELIRLLLIPCLFLFFLAWGLLRVNENQIEKEYDLGNQVSEENSHMVGNLWQQYIKRRRRWLLPVIVAGASFFIMKVLIEPLKLPIPSTPCRGVSSCGFDEYILKYALYIMYGLFFYVLYWSMVTLAFINRLNKANIEWEPAVLQRWATERYTLVGIIDGYKRLELVGDVTAPIKHLIWYPVVALFILVISRNRIFDGWTFPTFLMIDWSLYILITLGCLFVLRWQAEKIRAAVLTDLDKLYRKSQNIEFQPSARLAEQIPLIAKAIQDNKTGMLAPMLDQPVVGAVLLIILGILQHFVIG